MFCFGNRKPPPPKLSPRLEAIWHPTPSDPIERVQKQMVHLPGAINNFRQSQGLAQIPLSDELCQSATQKAEHMVIHGYFGHEGPEGNPGWAWDLARAEGYPFSGMAENILACSHKTAATAICKIWEDSPDHRGAMLANWDEFGVGFAVNEDGMVYVAGHFATRR